MCDGAPGAAEGDSGERDAQVLRLGAAGRGRAEIAAVLGMSPAALAAREAEDAALAAALSEAAGLALAWWEGVAREAVENGRFSLAAWTREMRRRFGEGGPGPDGQIGAPRAGRAGLQRPGIGRPRVTYRLPCNGMEKPGPDGRCGCGAFHDDEYWRAEDEAWRAESPEHAEWPSLDELEDEDDDEGESDDENGFGDDNDDENDFGEIDDEQL